MSVLRMAGETMLKLGYLTDSEDEYEYELSHGKKRKPRKPVTPAPKGKRKGKARKLDNVKLSTEVEARRLDNLFDKLPTEVIYIVSCFSFSCYQ